VTRPDPGNAPADLGNPARPASGGPHPANLNRWAQTKVNVNNQERGPLLLISGAKDHTVPWALTNAAYTKQRHNPAITEIAEIHDRATR
jgi:non-heme chloroperoxidase